MLEQGLSFFAFPAFQKTLLGVIEGCYIPPMAKDPKNFTGEDMQRLLKRESTRRREIRDFKGMLIGLGALACIVVLVWILSSWVADLLR